MNQIVIVLKFIFLVFLNVQSLVVISHQNSISEGRCIKELLKHRIHVTNTSQIFHTNITCSRSTLVTIHTVRINVLFGHFV